ncbi:MAG TPA: PEP-CTERM sorting domain-containing protein [Candidatus Limnocylindrales bacterium]|nr:PEP-CTERM sorting domain-containing protein [Candidatus Limnocylindrales bacterium]
MVIDMSFVRRGAIYVLAACTFALALCGTATAQVLTCPVNSDVSISGTVANVAPTCIISFGVTVSINSTGTLVNDDFEPLGGILENEGTIKNDGTLQNGLEQTITNFGTIFNNNYLDIRSGTLTNAGLIDSFGTITDSIGLGGSLNNIGTLTNTGSMTLFDTVLNTVGAQFNNTGTVSLSGYFVEPFPGDNTFTNNGTLTNYASGVVLAAVVFDNSGSITNYGTFYTGGIGTQPPVFTNTGTITNYGTFSTSALEAFPATVTNNGTITNYGTFLNAPSAFVTNNATFDNFGTLTNQAPFRNSVTGSIINETGATISLDANYLDNYGAITNNGAITITNNSGVGNLYNAGTITNNGSIANNGGALFVETGGTLTNSAGSRFVQTAGQMIVNGTVNSVPAVQIQGGTLSGLGTINGNVNNSGGSVEAGEGLGGTFTINGDYTQGTAGMLQVDLANGSLYGVLDVSGLATLDGIVDFDAISGFAPVAGDDFTFLYFGSLSGEFASVEFDGWTCPTDDTCELIYGTNSVSLDIMGPNGNGGGGTTTPEPGGMWLLCAGLMAMVATARRRRRGAIQPAA